MPKQRGLPFVRRRRIAQRRRGSPQHVLPVGGVAPQEEGMPQFVHEAAHRVDAVAAIVVVVAADDVHPQRGAQGIETRDLGPQGRIDPAAREVDQACAALIADLKHLGMFDETLLVWSGEFGRTPMSQSNKGPVGRDHHNKSMSLWLAGAGVRGGLAYGATDELGYSAVEQVCTIHDLHATMLHQLGIQHDAFSVKFQGLDAKLTGVEGARVLTDILA